jgi:hypothetical protein
MARHAMVDLSQIFSLSPIHDAADRLPPERYEQLYKLLSEGGVSVCRDGRSVERLRELRALYEGYAEALGRYLCMPLPPWISDQPHKDNWLAVARLRAQTEAANPPLNGGAPFNNESDAVVAQVDDHHDF